MYNTEACCQGCYGGCLDGKIKYQHANINIKKMQTNCKFQKITTAGVKESHIHDIAVTKEAPNYKTER